MKKSIISAIISIGFLAPYAGAEVNFDQGVDVKAAITEAVSADVVLPAADRYPGYTRYTRDCASFSYGPSDIEIMSERVRLQSTEYVQECHTTMQPGPNNTQVPVQHCYERPGQTWRETVRLNIKQRKLLPWERETFDICLEGPWSSLYVREAGYKYNERRLGGYDTLFELTPQYKIATRPDENGLSIGEFSYAGGKYSFKVNDAWAKEYAGEKVAIKVDLFRAVPGWFDGFRGGKEFMFSAAPGYEMSFAESDLGRSPAADNKNLNDPDKGYEVITDEGTSLKFYLKWGFRRLGAISKDDFINKGHTPSVVVN
ncbi:MAG: hypothetical protein WCK75_05665 [Elusimicrobiota bacterium]